MSEAAKVATPEPIVWRGLTLQPISEWHWELSCPEFLVIVQRMRAGGFTAELSIEHLGSSITGQGATPEAALNMVSDRLGAMVEQFAECVKAFCKELWRAVSDWPEVMPR